MNETAWTALLATLTVIFLLITLWAFRARGAAAGLRGLAVTLLPAAAWLTGSLDLFTDLSAAAVDWARNTPMTREIQAGLGVLAAAALLWLIGGRPRTQAVARARAARREQREAPAASAAARTSIPSYGASATRSSPSTPPGRQSADAEFSEVEDILKQRGIS